MTLQKLRFDVTCFSSSAQFALKHRSIKKNIYLRDVRFNMSSQLRDTVLLEDFFSARKIEVYIGKRDNFILYIPRCVS